MEKSKKALKLKVLACKVMARELSMVAWDCPNSLDITTIRQSYHNTPVNLRTILQEEIDRIESGEDRYTNSDLEFDAIVLGYGLCSNAVTGLTSKKYPLIVPKAHDCTTMFLGSKERYMELFQEYKGTFFYNQSWAEVMPDQGAALLERKRQEYMEQYEDDEDTVEYLMDIERMMLANYHGYTFIHNPELDDSRARAILQGKAKDENWDYYEVDGSMRLFRELVAGNWNEEDFLIVPPGKTIVATGDDRILAVR